jgi:plasmid stabilization system protein ParE
MRVVITAAAKADLLAIRRYIEADNPTRAVSFVEELLDRCLALADTPRAYPLVPRYERFGIRRCVHGNYLIFTACSRSRLRSSTSCRAHGISKRCCSVFLETVPAVENPVPEAPGTG